MEYTPKEIEEETGISVDNILRAIRAGDLSARKAANGHYWIHGLTFADYVRSTVKHRISAPNKFYCFKCRKVVFVMTDITIEGRLAFGVCPECQAKVTKIADKKQLEGQA